jgi:hypothetical protein
LITDLGLEKFLIWSTIDELRKQKKTQQFFCDEKPCCFIRKFRRRLKFTSSLVEEA